MGEEVLAAGIAVGMCGCVPARAKEGGNAVRKCGSVTVAAMSAGWHWLHIGMSYVSTARSGERLSSLILLMVDLNTSLNCRAQ